MMDTFNLTWKIAAAIKHVSPRSILSTYQAERRRVAIDLINFDHKFSRLFSGRPAKDAADEAGISLEEFKLAFEKGNEFASGTAVDYGASLICGKDGSTEGQGDGTQLEGPGAVSRSELSQGSGFGHIAVGKRFNTAQVVNQSDAKPVQLVDFMPSDGRWWILVFCGDIREAPQKTKVELLATKLGNLQQRYTPKGQDIDTVVDILTVSATPRGQVELTDYPPALRPHTTRWHQPHSGGDGRKALSQDYWKVSARYSTLSQSIPLLSVHICGTGVHGRRVLPQGTWTRIRVVRHF